MFDWTNWINEVQHFDTWHGLVAGLLFNIAINTWVISFNTGKLR